MVVRFYERNTGFFLFVFYLMFGIVESSQLISYHFSLMTGIMTSPVFLAIVCGLWLLYMIKCLQFVLSRLSLQENEFVFRISLLERSKHLSAWLITLIWMDAPVLGYSALLLGVSLYHKNFIVAAIVMVFHAAVLLTSGWLIRKKVNSIHRESRLFRLPVIRWPLARPLPFFYVGHVTEEMKIVFWVTKAFSIFCIIGFFQIAEDDPVRVALLGLLFGLASHSVIVFEFRRFEDAYLRFTRNLPLSFIQRFGAICLAYLLLLLPETALMLTNHVHPAAVAGMIAYAVGFLLFIHCSLYTGIPDMEKHTLRLLGLFLVSFLLILCHAYLAEMVVLWMAAGILWNKNFYRFEA